MSKRDNGWAELGGYMGAKMSKLENQFNSGTGRLISNIFSGVCIFIDGYTDPSDYEIKDIMQLHGGKFCHYYSREVVTHIVATNLPKSKINKLTIEKVVKPNWIVDSVEAGRLLEWSDYELYSTRHQSNQSMMKSFIQSDSPTEASGKVVSMSEYYAKSRLHHLSTWANELNNFLQALKGTALDNHHNNGETLFPGRSGFMDYYHNSGCDNTVVVNSSEPLLLHIDMDCFFESVGIRDHPELIGKPVVVTHSSKGDSPTCSTAGSMSAIASCSYAARKFGIHNGMHVGKAKSLCPDLIMIPYNFDAYLEVAKVLYKTAAGFTHDIEVGSCDELYINLMDLIRLDTGQSTTNSNKATTVIDPLIFAQYIRSVIRSETRCPASCGIGSNFLICKLATKKAKPDGQFWLKMRDVGDAIKDMNVRDLPGVGRVLERKLNDLDIVTCAQLQQLAVDKLKLNFGTKLGQRLFDMCRGKDNRSMKTERTRKSISAEMNYGIRLQTMAEVEILLNKLSTELSTRLVQAGVTGGFLALKIMIRRPNTSVESVKYLGHGICDNYSKSMNLPRQTNDAECLSRHTISLFKQLKKDITDLRGVGLSMHRLEQDKLSAPSNSAKKIDNYFTGKSNATHEKTITPITIHDDDDFDDGDDDCLILDVTSSDGPLDGDEIFEEEADQVEDNGSFPVIDKTTARPQTEIFKKPLVVPLKSINKAIRPIPRSAKSEDSKRLPLDYESSDTNTLGFLERLGNSSMDVLREEITKWVLLEPVPDIEDYALIKRHILQMVAQSVPGTNELIIHLKDVIIRQHGQSENFEIWESCYDNIIQLVQAYYYQTFGAYLELE